QLRDAEARERAREDRWQRRGGRGVARGAWRKALDVHDLAAVIACALRVGEPAVEVGAASGALGGEEIARARIGRLALRPARERSKAKERQVLAVGHAITRWRPRPHARRPRPSGRRAARA